MAQEIKLYGSQRLTPLVPTVYNLIADPDATNSSNNNTVYINFDLSLASATFNLPSISSFNGKWNVELIFNRIDLIVIPNTFTLTWSAADFVIVNGTTQLNQPLTYGGTPTILTLKIYGENKWWTPYY